MKKRIAILLLLMMTAVSTASAGTVTAMAVGPYLGIFTKCACYARILDYDSATNMLELELIAPEIFREDEISELQPGDSIYTEGHEVEIRTITEEYGYIVLNEGDYDFSPGSIWLMQDSDGNYRPVYYGDYTWMILKQMQVPVTGKLIFLDMIDPSTGGALEIPTVHSAEEFLQMKDETPGFKSNNVFVVFDEDGNLAVIQRYYVPWQ